VEPFRKSFILKAVLSYAVIQFVYLSFVDLPFTSDSLEYYRLASDCINRDTFYPASHNLHDNYILASTYVNYLSLVLRIYHHPVAVRISNIALNLIQISLIYAVTRLLFRNERQSRIAVLLYAAYLTNIGIIFYNYSEILFGVLLLLCLYLYLLDTATSTSISGIVLALACNTRLIGLALCFSILTVGIVRSIREDRISTKTIRFLGGFLFTLALIGAIAKLHTGYFVPLPTNGGINILIGANDDATGAFNDRVSEPGKAGYISNPDSLTFRDKERFVRDVALQWIGRHPWRWVGLVPSKLFHLFGRDDWAIPALLNSDRWNAYSIAKLYFKEHRPQDIFAGESPFFIVAFIAIFILHHIYYYILIGLMIYQFRYYRKRNLGFVIQRNTTIYLFVLLGIVFTLCTVGTPRYHYSFIIILIPTIAPMIDAIVQRKGFLTSPHFSVFSASRTPHEIKGRVPCRKSFSITPRFQHHIHLQSHEPYD
jgi:hypothetical protein